MTGDREGFRAAAGQYLRSRPVEHTVPLTVLETMRHSGASHYGEAPPFFGWHQAAEGHVDGAFLRTPPFPLLLAGLPAGSAASLLGLLDAADSTPPSVNVAGSDAGELAAAWVAATGGSATPRQRSRLFRLAGLVPPDPLPPGAARVAGPADTELLVAWQAAFTAETGAGAADPFRTVTDFLSHGGLMLWEADGEAVAMAALSRKVAGVVRVQGVYTPAELRRRGYGGAITTAVSKAALAGGAAEVVLFTDLANPTSNALYRRLGYRPVQDRVLLGLEPDLTRAAGTSS